MPVYPGARRKTGSSEKYLPDNGESWPASRPVNEDSQAVAEALKMRARYGNEEAAAAPIVS
jgi:hypothetical protein